MSYIHKALKKAQRERDAYIKQYTGVLSARVKKSGMFFSKPVLWGSLAAIICLLAFASHSWFSSKPQESSVTQKIGIEQSEKDLVYDKLTSDPVITNAAMDRAIEKPLRPPVQRTGFANTNLLDAKELYEKAGRFHRSGRLQDAKRVYQETITIDPNHVDALNNLGVIYIHEQNFEAARSSFEKALRQAPGSADLNYNLACVYALEGDLKQGLAYLEKACSLNEAAKEWASTDTDLESLWKAPQFKDITGIN